MADSQVAERSAAQTRKTGVLGSGAYQYRVEEGWAKSLPDGWSLGDIAGVGVDRQDRVYAFSRTEHPVIVFDREGNFLHAWGEGQYSNPHGVYMGPDDSIYLTDNGTHTVRKCTLDGKLLLELGTRGKPSAAFSGQPFCKCTHTAVSRSGDIYVTDGYGNAKVHKYSAGGTHLKSWGESGRGPGQFYLPHNIYCDASGLVYVADRENHKIQVFDEDGTYVTEWTNLHRPASICVMRGDESLFYVGELGPAYTWMNPVPNIGPRISIMDRDGEVVQRLGDACYGIEPGEFISPHGIAIDSHGDLYVAEPAHADWLIMFPDKPRPKTLRTLQKVVRDPA